MDFSKLREVKISNDIVGVFGGYNHNESSIKDGEFFEMKNLTSSFYPALSPRKQRGTYDYPNNANLNHKANGIYSKGSLCYVDGTDLFIDNTKVTGVTLTDTKKQFASMGTYLIIMPDKKYVNTIDFSDNGSLDRIWQSTSGSITVTNCDFEGNNYNITAKQSTAPASPKDGDCYIDTSGDVACIKKYYESQKKWKEVSDNHIKLTVNGTQDIFEDGDEVLITGLNVTAQPLFDIIEGKKHTLRTIYETDTSKTAIVIEGFINAVGTLSQTASIKLSALMPNLDFIIESGNRLWGCRYGNDLDGNFVNEIYSSKLGDFKNWNCFKGTSMDSYVATCGSDGEFTGAITHLGYPMFFKENCLHKVYGNYPSNFQIQTTACRGVMKGAAGSLSLVNENIMYKSRTGICVFDGSLPKEVSGALGEIHYTGVDELETDTLRNGAVAGFFQNKYYISMKSEFDSKWHLFVYDVTNGLWHREDNTRVTAFCSHSDELYYIDNKVIKTVTGSGVKDTEQVEWVAETGVIGVKMKENKYTVSLIGKKYISKLLIRMSLDIGSKVYFYIQYDSIGDWEPVATLVGTTLKSFNIPIKAKRCDHFRLKLIGYGDAKIFSIAKSIEQGSDV